MGHVILTSHLLPLLKRTADAGNTVRIVNLASNAHEVSLKLLGSQYFQRLDEIY